jgi:hypothetical protein
MVLLGLYRTVLPLYLAVLPCWVVVAPYLTGEEYEGAEYEGATPMYDLSGKAEALLVVNLPRCITVEKCQTLGHRDATV